MNIYRNELKSLRKSAFIWICSLTALAVLYLSIYPTVANDANDFKAILSNYPATVREMLGVNLDSIASLLGYYSMTFSFILLFGAIQAMNLGVSILSKESRERTADFLLVKPITRSAIVSAKLLAALTVIVVTNLFYNVFSLILAGIVKTGDYDHKVFFLINLSLLFVQLVFLAFGMAVSMFFKKIRSVLPISLGFVFGFYLVGSILSTGENKEIVRYISPFEYFDTSYIIKHSTYETRFLLLSIFIIVISIAVSYFIYRNKDIHAVS